MPADLCVRGEVHALAYAKPLEELTGATVSNMLSIANRTRRLPTDWLPQ